MNWLPLVDALHVALVQTFATICPKKPSACGEIQHRVILLSKEILLDFEGHGQPPAGDQWQAKFQALRDGLAKSVDASARNGTSLDPAVCNGLNALVSETRNLARKHAGEPWRYINRYWDSVGIIAERMKKECEAKYAPSLQTVFYWSSQATVQSLKILRDIAKRHANDPMLYRTTMSAIEDVRFGIRLQQIVNGSAAAKRRNCKRLLNWAIGKRQKVVPTLTSGLPCLLPKHAPEAVAVFKRQMQDRSSKPQRYILNTLAML